MRFRPQPSMLWDDSLSEVKASRVASLPVSAWVRRGDRQFVGHRAWRSVVPLRPPEFRVSDPASPFGNDILGRRPSIEALTRVIVDEDGPAVISVNGGFGSGKSAFLKMLAADLRLQDRVDVQEFNAWQQSHTADPLVDIVSALAHGRDDREPLLELVRKFGRRVVIGVAAPTVGALSGGMIDLTALEGAQQDAAADPFSIWASTEQHVAEFRDGLRAFVEKGRGADTGPIKLVVIVDELDRCRPDYAIDLLNVVRHLFAVSGVVIVLGVNRVELEHRVVEVFGPETAADVYLRRFVDLSVRLRSPDDVQMSNFVSHQLQSAGTTNSTFVSALQQALEMLARMTGTSARDVQQLARTVAPSSPAQPSMRGVTEVAIVTLMVLRHVAPSVYEEFVSDRCDAFAAATAMRTALPLDDRSAVEFGGALQWMEGVLWQMGNSDGYCAIEKPDFAARYVKAGLGDAEQAAAVVGHASQSYVGIRGHRLRARAVADRIELTA